MRDIMIRNKDLDALVKKCKNANDLKMLIIKGINEDIKMTETQLLRLVAIKRERYGDI
jgi:hypothetical protein